MDLPNDFPHRAVLAAAGVTTFEDLDTAVQLGSLTDIKGVDQAAADEIANAALAYVPVFHPGELIAGGEKVAVGSREPTSETVQVTGPASPETATPTPDAVAGEADGQKQTTEVALPEAGLNAPTAATIAEPTEVPANAMPPGGKFLSPETRIEAAMTNINAQIASVRGRTNSQGQPDRAALNIIADRIEQVAAALHDRLSDDGAFKPASEFASTITTPPPKRLEPVTQMPAPAPGSAARWPFMGLVGEKSQATSEG